MPDESIFKRCPSCFTEWQTREEFLRDDSLELHGYKVDFKELEYGLFFFTHKKAGCFSTMALQTGKFLDMYSGPRYAENKAGSKECPRYCTTEKQLSRCDALCECAFVREVIDMIVKRQQAQ